LSSSASKLLYTNIEKPFFSPHVFPVALALQMKVLLLHYTNQGKFVWERDKKPKPNLLENKTPDPQHHSAKEVFNPVRFNVF
jgi:hypothetical protein